jgi:hypothetical protein
MKKSLFMGLLVYLLLGSFGVVQSQVETTDSQKTNQEQIDELKRQVEQLQGQLKNLEELPSGFAESLRSLIVTAQYMFGFSLAIITLFYGLTTFLQYRRDLREAKENQEKHRFLVEQSQKHEEYIQAQEKKSEKQDEKYKELLDSTKSNIEQTTALLSALEDMFKLKTTASELQTEIDDMKMAQETAKHKFLQGINREAMQMCATMKRNDYLDFGPQIREFCIKLNAGLQEYAIDKRLNANCYLILGLDSVLRGLYREALEPLEKAISDAAFYAKNGTDDSLLYPAKNREEIKVWNKKLANISCYHAGIVLYNLGEYKQAESKFRDALVYDKRDIESMIYIPETKFLGRLDTFENIIADYNQIKDDIDGIKDTSNWREAKGTLLSQFYVRYGNCYFPGCYHKPYQKNANLKQTEMLYKKAYGADSDFYLAKFSYAQALSIKSARDIPEADKLKSKTLSNQLFLEVFEIVKERIAATSETKIRIMLYYMLAICCKQASLENEQAKMYLMEIYKEGANLPSQVSIFSPLTKNNLSYQALTEEVKTFEKEL